MIYLLMRLCAHAYANSHEAAELMLREMSDYCFQLYLLAAHNAPARDTAPQGNGESVFLIPGFLAEDRSLYALGVHLERHNCRIRYARVKSHLICPFSNAHVISEKVKEVSCEKKRVSLIGHSLGAFVARIIASRIPGHVSRVITIGAANLDHSNVHPFAHALYERVRALHAHTHCAHICGDSREKRSVLENIRAHPLPMDVVNIYSKNDAVANAHDCSAHPPGERCIEVSASHSGMTVSPEVFAHIEREVCQSA